MINIISPNSFSFIYALWVHLCATGYEFSKTFSKLECIVVYWPDRQTPKHPSPPPLPLPLLPQIQPWIFWCICNREIVYFGIEHWWSIKRCVLLNIHAILYCFILYCLVASDILNPTVLVGGELWMCFAIYIFILLSRISIGHQQISDSSF